MGASNYLEEKWLNDTFVGKNVYVALFTSDPTDANTGIEVMGGAYTRLKVTFSAPTQVNGKGTVQNTADIQFPIATARWGVITNFGVYDALTGGNLLYHGTLTITKEIDVSDRMTLSTGKIVLNVD